MNFTGEWITEIGLTATVFSEFMQSDTFHWFGAIRVGNLVIPTFWGVDGNSTSPQFNLVRKRRGEEEWPPKK